MDPRLLDDLHDDLVDADFTVDRLAALWGGPAGEALQREDAGPARRGLRRLRASGDVSAALVLAEIFLLGLPGSVPELDTALPRLGVAGAVELGLVAAPLGSALRAAVDLRPYAFSDARGEGHWWILSDLGELARGAALEEDHVLGVGGASMTLSRLMFDSPVGSVLDLGTGCGIQAMHARRFADRVVATDISLRALQLARANARLNRIDGIEFRLGSLFEPVAGERFDRIVSNPPFVITPRVDGVPLYEYRDGGRVGDGLVREVVIGVAEHLVDGGSAQLLGNWEYRSGADGLARLAAWVAEDAPVLDLWAIERELLDPVQYSETWIRDGGTRPGTDEFAALQEHWLDDFETRRVTAVGFGYLLLRRRRADGAPPLRRTERLGGPIAPDAALGSHLEHCLREHDALAALSAVGRVTDARLIVSGDVTEERHHRPGDEDPSVIQLRQGSGFGRTIGLGTALAAVVGASDGELTLGVLIEALGELLEVDPATLAGDVLPLLPELVIQGFLRVA